MVGDEQKGAFRERVADALRLVVGVHGEPAEPPDPGARRSRSGARGRYAGHGSQPRPVRRNGGPRSPRPSRCPLPSAHGSEPLAHLVQHGRPVAVRNTGQVGLGEGVHPVGHLGRQRRPAQRKRGIESTSKPLASTRSAYFSAVGKDHGFRSSASITASGFRSAAAPGCRRGPQREGWPVLARVVPASAVPRVAYRDASEAPVRRHPPLRPSPARRSATGSEGPSRPQHLPAHCGPRRPWHWRVPVLVGVVADQPPAVRAAPHNGREP